MVVVKKKKGESTDRLIARFKKQVLEAGIIPEARDRSRFIPKGEKKKKEKKEKEFRIKVNKKRDL